MVTVSYSRPSSSPLQASSSSSTRICSSLSPAFFSSNPVASSSGMISEVPTLDTRCRDMPSSSPSATGSSSGISSCSASRSASVSVSVSRSDSNTASVSSVSSDSCSLSFTVSSAGVSASSADSSADSSSLSSVSSASPVSCSSEVSSISDVSSNELSSCASPLSSAVGFRTTAPSVSFTSSHRAASLKSFVSPASTPSSSTLAVFGFTSIAGVL